MEKNYNDTMKKITSSFKMPELNLSSYTSSLPAIADLKKITAEIRREKEEEIQRGKDTVEFLRNLYELAKENPASIQQHIQTLVQNSGVIQNWQNVHSGATGVQNITNNTGVQAEEILKLLNSMREISDIMVPERAEEAKDLIDELEQEVQKPEAKKGRIKASLTYLKSLFTEIVGNPTKSIAKAQFTEYAQEKAPEIIQGIDDIFTSML